MEGTTSTFGGNVESGPSQAQKTTKPTKVAWSDHLRILKWAPAEGYKPDAQTISLGSRWSDFVYRHAGPKGWRNYESQRILYSLADRIFARAKTAPLANIAFASKAEFARANLLLANLPMNALARKGEKQTPIFAKGMAN